MSRRRAGASQARVPRRRAATADKAAATAVPMRRSLTALCCSPGAAWSPACSVLRDRRASPSRVYFGKFHHEQPASSNHELRRDGAGARYACHTPSTPPVWARAASDRGLPQRGPGAPRLLAPRHLYFDPVAGLSSGELSFFWQSGDPFERLRRQCGAQANFEVHANGRWVLVRQRCFMCSRWLPGRVANKLAATLGVHSAAQRGLPKYLANILSLKGEAVLPSCGATHAARRVERALTGATKQHFHFFSVERIGRLFMRVLRPGVFPGPACLPLL